MNLGTIYGLASSILVLGFGIFFVIYPEKAAKQLKKDAEKRKDNILYGHVNENLPRNSANFLRVLGIILIIGAIYFLFILLKK